jgi:hypothetical protein
MKIKPAPLVLGAVGLALGVLSVLALREATLSTHEDVAPDSRAEIVLRARSRGGERGQSVPEMVHALILSCRLEVHSDIVGPIQAEGRNRFRAVLQPALDRTDRRQLRGCLEDWTIDQLRVDVLELTAPL